MWSTLAAARSRCPHGSWVSHVSVLKDPCDIPGRESGSRMEAHGSGVWEAAASSLPPPRAPSDWSESILSPNPRPAAQHSDSCPGSQPRLPVWRAPPSLSLPSLPALSLCCSPLVPSSFSLYFSPAVFPLFLWSVPAFLSASISLSLPLRLSLSDVALCPSVTVSPFCFPLLSRTSVGHSLRRSPCSFLLSAVLPGLSVRLSLPACPFFEPTLTAALSPCRLFLARPRPSPRHPVCLSLCFPGRQL